MLPILLMFRRFCQIPVRWSKIINKQQQQNKTCIISPSVGAEGVPPTPLCFSEWRRQRWRDRTFLSSSQQVWIYALTAHCDSEFMPYLLYLEILSCAVMWCVLYSRAACNLWLCADCSLCAYLRNMSQPSWLHLSPVTTCFSTSRWLMICL